MSTHIPSAKDYQYMAQALRLAEQGLYSTTPNPRVGCVIVKDGKVIGEGAHLKAGEPHAEVNAIQHALAQGHHDLSDAEVYVTLEPCSHYGHTPPCAEALIKAGVARVIVAMQDPNPLVAGCGLALLKQKNIKVTVGVMEAEAQQLNAGFISRMTRGMPFVRSKIAASLDGRTALAGGESKWITGDAARSDVHHWRAQSCAILTGIGTVLADNPSLTVRLQSNLALRQPLRVVVDSQLSISPDATILQGGKTLIAYAHDPDNKSFQLNAENIELLQLADSNGKVCLKSLLQALAARGINEVMCEAGQNLNGALLVQSLIDELVVYYAPVILGSDAMGMFAIPPLTSMQQRLNFELIDMKQIGHDVRLRFKAS